MKYTITISGPVPDKTHHRILNGISSVFNRVIGSGGYSINWEEED